MGSLESLLSYLDLRTILLCSSVFLAVCWNMRRTRNLPPGPFGIPILGCLPTLGLAFYKSGLEVHQFFARLAVKYGKIFSLQFGGKYVILLSDYDTIKTAFQNPHLINRPRNPAVKKLKVEPGVLQASGESWKQQRRFTLSTLRDFGIGKRGFEDQIAIETKALVNELLLQQHKPFDPRHFLGPAVSNVICSVIFGKRYEYSDEDLKRLLDNLNQQLKLIGSGGFQLFFPFLRYLKPKSSQVMREVMKGKFMELRQYVTKIIEEHRQDLDPDNSNDFIDVFLKEIQTTNKPHLNEGTLVSTIVNLFSAGSETTATTLRWSLLYMIAYPDIQQTIHQEIDDIVGRNRFPRLSDMPQLPYTEATLLEVQRIATILPLGGPHCAAEDTTLNGFNIPKGAILIANVWAVHHDPKVWKDPLEFNPSRFLDQSGHVRHPPEFIPFLTGRRMCLGENLAKMELVLFFTHLMHQFAFKKPTESTQLSLEANAGLTNAPHPFEMVVTQRDRNGYC